MEAAKGSGARPRGPHPSRGGRRETAPRRHATLSPLPVTGEGNTLALRASTHSLAKPVIPSGARCTVDAVANVPAGPPRNPAAAAARPVVRHPALATRTRAAQRAPTAARRGRQRGARWPAIPRGRLLQRKRTLRGADSRRGRLGSGRRACRPSGADSSTGPHGIRADSVPTRRAPLNRKSPVRLIHWRG